MQYRHTMTVTDLGHYGDDATIASDARTSTKGLEGHTTGYENMVGTLWSEGHVSPFDHAFLKIGLEVPTFVRDQLVRHHSARFSIESARYRTLQPVFYLPPAGAPLAQQGRAMDYQRTTLPEDAYQAGITATRAVHQAAWDAYETKLNLGWSKEQARGVLGPDHYIAMIMSARLRDWLFILTARTDPHAQYETRQAALQIEEIIAEHFPVAHRAWQQATARTDLTRQYHAALHQLEADE
nr:FAD-dependent thymidylate synthase [Brevibacterium sp. 68QC2CO]